MIVEYRTNPEDLKKYIEHNVLRIKRGSPYSWPLEILKYVYTVIFLFALFVLLRKMLTNHEVEFFEIVLFAGLLMGIVGYLYNKQRKTTDILGLQEFHQGLLGEQKLIFVEEGLINEQIPKKIKVESDWNSVSSIEITKDHIFIFLNNMLGIIIPKDTEKIDEIKDYLLKKAKDYNIRLLQ